MEKKTIGKFISVLRKANGMTQKDFGEKLFVSDKTVSRWERDECTPDLYLIPAIAEIFGITADELLRGERNNPERSDEEHREEGQRAKSEKQFRLLLERNSKKYQNFTMISIGITILGLISAMIANLSFSKGLIAFCLTLAFCTASEICQICFAVNARFSADEEDESRAQQFLLSNNNVMKTAIRISFFNLLSVAFCLPLVVLLDSPSYYGLEFSSWLLWGGLFVLAIGVFTYIFYVLRIHSRLCVKGLYSLTSSEKEAVCYNKKFLLKTVAVSLSIIVALGIGVFVLEEIGVRGLARKEVFDTCEDFKAFMENQYDTEKYYFGTPLKKEDGKILNSEGEVICEYYFHKSLNESILFTESAEDKMPVTVITRRAYNIALNNYDYLHILLYGLMVFDVVACGIFYLRKMKRV